ncbi:hypothetical protein BX264_2835 [Streptomyces sp. 2333.5]|uniref:hypothetical protein n=1 Tax=Streptomyces TaxID=1883 RepID=UPI00089CB5EF|nr:MULTISPECIES: hypothetical protein [unclassified Streptomyces]PJJ02489.1 hypothetical protein BX264_2835 [Streptomyces sp. 2333.5]SED12520.1 hypothetical protein SAMN05428943_2975 [Streptomyces sp. 2314.4]SED99679.1 hypothetical protein SAMN05428942_2938 [Streptomyces sp. 2112.2]
MRETWLSRWAPYAAGVRRGPDMETTGADDQPTHERADAGDSEALTRLRARVHEDYARRQQYGPLGRSL